MPTDKVQPRTFFLNETHEFVRGEKEGGGQPPHYAPIDWGKRGSQLRASLDATRKAVSASADPLRDRRYFMLAAPEKVVAKTSTAKNKPSIFDEATHYAGEHSRVFRRLGVDLLHVAANGTAIVHSTADQVEQLAMTAMGLPHASAKEQARWATINSFAPIPPAYRIDLEWAQSVSTRESVDVIVELQPLLTTVEADEVMRAVLGFLDPRANEALVGAGTDFSGRQWFRGRAARKSLLAIAKNLFSVESVHRPMPTPVSAGARGVARRPAVLAAPTQAQIALMPVVAVVDCGVPKGHSVLATYSRGQFIGPDSGGVLGDHGSLVASRIVFGDLDFDGGVQAPPPGQCRFMDVVVSDDAKHVNPKSIIVAMEAVVANFPEVRVFNLSFGSYLALDAHGEVERREHLIAMRDLDNFVFARDVVVVVAAGNSPPGLVPGAEYPEHIDDPQWRLGSWCMGFNTLTCGATVGRAHPSGLAKSVDWPSPFTRIGPGICGAPIPEFGAPGGDCAPNYRYATPLGVYGCCADGTWEDRPGSSFAAPLLAREAGFALQRLQTVCLPNARPFASTVKAFLALTAERPTLPPRAHALADRTIGRGYASARRLTKPRSNSVVVLWQGVLENSKDIARIQIPIPLDWLAEARSPRLKLLWSWDSPVHDAATELWACRRVNALLKPAAGSAAVRPNGKNHASYPLVERTYDLSAPRLAKSRVTVTSSLWLVEMAYEEIADYYPGIQFSPQQKVALAAELSDEDSEPVSPQAFVQRLPIAATMVSLGVPRAHITTPVVLKVRR